MKPAPFTYVRPETLAEAIELLADDDVKIIAGGQSLLPLMNFRLARPDRLVDVGRIVELTGVTITPTMLELGAMTRHSRIELDPAIVEAHPLVAFAASRIGHRAIRNHGTLGGSIAHADAAAEYPAVLTATGAHVTARSPRGERTIPATDLFLGHYSTDLASDEIIVTVTIPRLRSGQRWGFHEIARRPGDFAEAGAVAIVTPGDRLDVRIVTFATSTRPVLVEFGADVASIDRDLADALDMQSHLIDGDDGGLTAVVARRALDMAIDPSTPEAAGSA